MTNLAGLRDRLLAVVVDKLIFLIFWEALVLLLASASTIPSVLNNLFLLLILGLLLSSFLWLLFNSFLITVFGGTLGKLLTGIKIVRPGGSNLSFWRAFFRTKVGYFVSSLLFGLGFIWIIIDKDHRGWHDQITDDFVVKSRRLGLLSGLFSLILLLIASAVLFGQIIQSFGHHAKLYQGILNAISTGIKSLQPPTKTPHSPLSPAQRLSR